MALHVANRLDLVILHMCGFFFFFFKDTATTEIYTLSLHDALPICLLSTTSPPPGTLRRRRAERRGRAAWRSEEHTSELQSHSDLVCRLLLEKKKKTQGTEARPQLETRSRC